MSAGFERSFFTNPYRIGVNLLVHIEVVVVFGEFGLIKYGLHYRVRKSVSVSERSNDVFSAVSLVAFGNT